MVDTGSHFTVLQYEVVEALGAVDRIGALPQEPGRGFGGASMLSVIRAELAFVEDESRFRLYLRAMSHPNALENLPSVLGMDFISAFRLTIARRDNLVLLDPAF